VGLGPVSISQGKSQDSKPPFQRVESQRSIRTTAKGSSLVATQIKLHPFFISAFTMLAKPQIFLEPTSKLSSKSVLSIDAILKILGLKLKAGASLNCEFLCSSMRDLKPG